MPYIQLKTEYLHSSGIVEFVWLVFATLTVLVALVRFFKLQIPIHGEDLDKQENKEPGKDNSKDLNKQSDIQKAKEQVQSKTDKDPKQEEQKIQDDVNNIEIVIDENDQGSQQKPDQVPKQEKLDDEMQTIKRQQKRPEEKKPEEPADLKKVEPPAAQPDQQSRNSQIQETTLHIDEWIDKHLVSLTIAVLLINSWGCYIYTAFMTLLCIILCSVFNRYNILGRMKDGQFKDKRGFGELLFHFWILSLFIAYFVYDQSYSNNYTNYIA